MRLPLKSCFADFRGSHWLIGGCGAGRTPPDPPVFRNRLNELTRDEFVFSFFGLHFYFCSTPRCKAGWKAGEKPRPSQRMDFKPPRPPHLSEPYLRGKGLASWKVSEPSAALDQKFNREEVNSHHFIDPRGTVEEVNICWGSVCLKNCTYSFFFSSSSSLLFVLAQASVRVWVLVKSRAAGGSVAALPSVSVHWSTWLLRTNSRHSRGPFHIGGLT